MPARHILHKQYGWEPFIFIKKKPQKGPFYGALATIILAMSWIRFLLGNGRFGKLSRLARARAIYHSRSSWGAFLTFSSTLYTSSQRSSPWRVMEIPRTMPCCNVKLMAL